MTRYMKERTQVSVNNGGTYFDDSLDVESAEDSTELPLLHRVQVNSSSQGLLSLRE